MAVNRAVFFGKDGTLLRDVPYNVAPGKVELAPGAAQGLALLRDAGFKLIVVSNQPGIAHGYFTPTELWKAAAEVTRRLWRDGVAPDAFYFCPHHPDGALPRYAKDCACRKPRPGLLLRAASEHDIDLAGSWMIGDVLDDVEAGQAAGCRTVLLDNGGATQWDPSPGRVPQHVAVDLEQAGRRIVQHTPARRLQIVAGSGEYLPRDAITAERRIAQ